MPKLDGTHLPQRIVERLAELKAGKEVAIREIRALLNEEQQKEMDAAWEHQQELRKGKRARTKEEEKELGWKTKREIYIEAYERAAKGANEDELDALKKKLRDKEIRVAKIYMDEFSRAMESGKTGEQAKAAARNALTRAHLQEAESKRVEKRDAEVWAMEDALRKQIRNNLPEEERKMLDELEMQEKGKRLRGK